MMGRRFSKSTLLRLKPCFECRCTGFTLCEIGKTQSEQEHLGEVGPEDDNLPTKHPEPQYSPPKEPRSVHGNPSSGSQGLP